MTFRQMSFVAVNYGQDEFCRQSNTLYKYIDQDIILRSIYNIEYFRKTAKLAKIC